MADELDFTLPESGNRSRGKGESGGRLLLVVVLLAVLANIGLTLARRDARDGGEGPESAAVPAESQKQLALKLEKQGLSSRAAAAWQEYLGLIQSKGHGAATIWYRIGKLYQEAGDYELALESFYRSEAFAKIEDLGPEINRRTQELAHFGSDLSYEAKQILAKGDQLYSFFYQPSSTVIYPEIQLIMVTIIWLGFLTGSEKEIIRLRTNLTQALKRNNSLGKLIKQIIKKSTSFQELQDYTQQHRLQLIKTKTPTNPNPTITISPATQEKPINNSPPQNS